MVTKLGNTGVEAKNFVLTLGALRTNGANSATGYQIKVVGFFVARGGGVLVPASMAGKSKPYCELGKLLDNLARGRAVRGPYNIASYVENATGYEVSGQMVSKYLYGHSQPKPEFVQTFAEAFSLTPQERAELAWGYAYGCQLPWDRLREPASAR